MFFESQRFFPEIVFLCFPAAGGVLLFIGLWQLVANFYLEEEKELRRQLRETIKERFPEQTAEIQKTFGLFPFKGDREDAASAASARTSTTAFSAGFTASSRERQAVVASRALKSPLRMPAATAVASRRQSSSLTLVLPL